ncbi:MULTISPECIES: DUF3226 domain-containing protein [unclassified Dolichospermum]|uniref:DUF3226 domain-containing protein n=1 Tax=unclassified Dolichospermum TaxID=2622029 RepID=UPI0014462BF8|nr:MULTISPECIES: DUF3226 domain-containing protein [unclassified Dolichospermum]MTJ15613.1 hypothetical protein [Dolichospermum sp. UHCC 0299]MTJ41136.1 hypothetical protein [Dolichospermum sp. UHCC 0406]
MVKKLLVEGKDDLRVIPELIEKTGINWIENKKPIVPIGEIGGKDNLTSDLISTELQARGLTHLGLMIDADENVSDSWNMIRNACLHIESIPTLPEQIPETGLIIKTLDDKKFGVWIMPDNQLKGMLETFLAYMIPDESEPLWQYTQEVVTEAKARGAKFINSHIDKARIYSWLAWQNPPGRQLHNAIQEKILDPQHPKAQVFVKWFKDLYDL